MEKTDSTLPLTQSVPTAAAPAGAEEGHHHAGAPAFLPHWLQERWRLALVLLAGLALAIGWLGETFWGLPPQVALLFYLLAYVAGGWEIGTHAVPRLRAPLDRLL